MPELCELLKNAGLGTVKSYIQSGNLVMRSPISDKDSLSRQIGEEIKNKWGYDVPVQVFPQAAFEFILANNPFVKEDAGEEHLHATLLENKVEDNLDFAFSQLSFPGEEFRYQENVVYLRLPNGYGNSKLSNSFIERKLKTGATTRNWKTMKKLGEMIHEI